MTSLGEQLPKKIERCQQLLVEYAAVPNGAGAFGAAMIKKDIQAAHNAMMMGDLRGMIQAYKALKEC